MEGSYNIKTSVGTFRVEKTASHLKVGGKRFCVEIKFIDDMNSELQWLVTKDGGCELEDKSIRGNDTLHLLNLSFTILKIYKPGTIHVQFLDNSKFDCILADGSKSTIFVNKYNYLFYGGTWYDTKIDAVPIDTTQRTLYNETKSRYTDPSIKKPFDFKNKMLQIELSPIYDSVNTWKEFADALHEKYDKTELCRKILPWYLYAVAELTNNRMLPEFWIVDISNLPSIPFTQLAANQKGGRTRKRYLPVNIDHFLLSPGELYNVKC